MVVNDFYLESAEAVAGEIRAQGGRAFALQGDVSDPSAVRSAAQRVGREFGPIGVLVNNAGKFGAAPSAEVSKPFWETGPEVWNQIAGVNYYGPINCAAALVPQMIARDAPGRIITIISDAGRNGDSGIEIYSASKAGAAGLIRSPARRAITANALAIAATRAPMTEAALADSERAKWLLENSIVRCPGEPEDVANMVSFLASDASSWSSGQTYPVDGGFMAAL